MMGGRRFLGRLASNLKVRGRVEGLTPQYLRKLCWVTVVLPVVFVRVS